MLHNENYQSINIENQEPLNNQNNNLENSTWTTTIWNVSKKILNIADSWLGFSTKLGKLTMGGILNQNANLALPEATLLIFGGVINDINKINEKLYYQSKKELLADFIITISSLPVPLIIMLNRYPLPWGVVDEKWLDSIKDNSFLGYPPLLLSFNNIPKDTFLLLNATAISKTFIVFLKSLNTWKHQNNDENLSLLNNSNQVFENNKLEIIIHVIKKIEFFTELVAMINMCIFPPTLAERFGWTFKTVYDNPFWIQLGAIINIITSTINEFNIYNSTKDFVSNKIKYCFSPVERLKEIITTVNNYETLGNLEDDIETINNNVFPNNPSINTYNHNLVAI